MNVAVRGFNRLSAAMSAVAVMSAAAGLLVGCANPSAITTPGSPTGLVAAANSANSITIGWEAVPGASGYNIYRSGLTGAGIYSLVGRSTTNSYTDNGLPADKTYYYCVAAYNSAGTGSKSFPYSATTLPGQPMQPNAPTVVMATNATANSIMVSWTSVTDAVSYRIYRSENPSGPYDFVGSSTTTSYTDGGLTDDKEYYYRVRAYNSTGESPESISCVGKTQPKVPNAPNTPTVVMATNATANTIMVSWTSVTDADAYRIYRSENQSGPYGFVGSSTTTSYTDVGLIADKTYYYRVSAYNSVGESSQSDYCVGKTQPTDPNVPNVPNLTVPTAPTVVTATNAEENSITINWPSVTYAVAYRIYRSETSSGTPVFVGSSITTSYIDGGLPADKTYYYRVSAYNIAGESPQSSSCVGKTQPTPPKGP